MTSSQSSAPVVVLGYKFWQRRFNSDPLSVVGKIDLHEWITIHGKIVLFCG
jgi:hypothetical protein